MMAASSGHHGDNNTALLRRIWRSNPQQAAIIGRQEIFTEGHNSCDEGKICHISPDRDPISSKEVEITRTYKRYQPSKHCDNNCHKHCICNRSPVDSKNSFHSSKLVD